MSTARCKKIPVETEYGVRFESELMARIWALAPNAVKVQKRKGELARVILRSHTAAPDPRPAHSGRGAQRLSHDFETRTNPPRTWEFKRGVLSPAFGELK
jgi:hypothetical protein